MERQVTAPFQTFPGEYLSNYQMTGVAQIPDIQEISLNFREVLKVAVPGVDSREIRGLCFLYAVGSIRGGRIIPTT